MRQEILSRVRKQLANPRGESFVIGLAEHVPWARRLAFSLTPQPENYGVADERIVSRHGLRFRLRPSHYFQWHHLFKRDDAVLDELLHRARGQQIFIDVGANIGLYSLAVRRVMRFDARVLAVEPSTETADALREHLAWSGLSGVEVHECALSSTRGSAQLSQQTGDWGKASLARELEGHAQTTVQTRTLDEIVEEAQLPSVDLIKIDVEGHELEVLKGAPETLARFQPSLFIEFSPQWMSEEAVNEMVGYFRLLVAQGYGAFQILPDGLVELDVASVETGPSQANLVLVSPRFR